MVHTHRSYCVSTDEFEGSTERVEGERLLLEVRAVGGPLWCRAEMAADWLCSNNVMRQLQGRLQVVEISCSVTGSC